MKPEAKKCSVLETEESEPTARHDRIPVWPIAMLVLFAFWGGFYFKARGGRFNPQVYEPFRSIEQVDACQPRISEGDLFARGKRVYQTYCQVCHQANGQGTPGQFPPLAGSEWVLAKSPNRIINLLLNGGQGQIEVKGQIYGSATMPAWKDWLKNEDIAAVLTFIRQNQDWGNFASEVSPTQVQTVRNEIAGRSEPFTAEELKHIP